MCFYLCLVGKSSSPHFSFPFRVFRKNPFLFSFFDFGRKKPFPFFLFRFLKKFSISIPFSFLIFENRDFRNPFLFPFKGFVKGADPSHHLYAGFWHAVAKITISAFLHIRCNFGSKTQLSKSILCRDAARDRWCKARPEGKLKELAACLSRVKIVSLR